jgi:NitT/TauT family transport system substrate-binding protein
VPSIPARTLAWLLALAFTTAGCGGEGGSAPSASTSPIKVHAGLVGSVSDAAFFIAREKGYFVEQLIDLDIQRFQSAADMTPLLGTDQLQVGGGAPSAGLFNAMARDIPLKIVADKGNVDPGHGYEAMVVRKDLWDKGSIRTPADLRGKKIALASRNITPEVTLDTFLKTGGLTVKDVTVVPMAFPDMVNALANGSIDVGVPVEPFATLAVSKGVGVIWHRTDEIVPGHENAVVLFSPSFAANRDAARRFMVAYLKGARDYNDVFTKKSLSTKEEIVQILIRNTTVKDASLYDKMVMPGIDPNGRARKSSLVTDQDWFLQSGAQKAKTDLDKAVDNQFSDWAVQKLGTYK